MTVEEIKNKTEKFFKLSLTEPTRKSKYVLARTFYFKTAYKLCYPEMNLNKIGKAINRDHATALHHIYKYFNTKEQEKYNEFLMNLNVKISVSELKDKKLIDDLKNASDTIKLYQQQIRLLQNTKNKLTLFPKELIDAVLKLNEEQRKNVFERFLLISDMELKKKY